MESFKKFLDKKTPSIDQIAIKHNKPVDYMQQQLAAGIKVEMEHTNKKEIAQEIALDHLNEKPDYYIKLKKV